MTLLDYSPSLKQRTPQVAARQVHNAFGKVLTGRQLVCTGAQGARSSILVKAPTQLKARGSSFCRSYLVAALEL